MVPAGPPASHQGALRLCQTVLDLAGLGHLKGRVQRSVGALVGIFFFEFLNFFLPCIFQTHVCLEENSSRRCYETF